MYPFNQSSYLRGRFGFSAWHTIQPAPGQNFGLLLMMSVGRGGRGNTPRNLRSDDDRSLDEEERRWMRVVPQGKRHLPSILVLAGVRVVSHRVRLGGDRERPLPRVGPHVYLEINEGALMTWNRGRRSVNT